jgi:hypothetical protein
MHVVATELIPTACFINPRRQSVSVYVSRLPLLGNGSVKYNPLSVLGKGSINTFPRQQLHVAIEEISNACICGSLRVSAHHCKATTWWWRSHGNEGIWEVSSSMLSLYQRKMGDWFFLEIPVMWISWNAWINCVDIYRTFNVVVCGTYCNHGGLID